MKIGILGTGIVGQTVGTGFIQLGHEVRMGSRDVNNEKAIEWATAAGENASVGTFADAAAFGEILVLATKWLGTENAIQLTGAENTVDKIVIDATNPLKFSEKGPEWALGFSDSAGEQIQRWLPDAKVVKAWNTVPAALMVDATIFGEMPDMFICGDDVEAKATVTDIMKMFKWESVIDLGGIEQARLLEAMTMVWVRYYAISQNWQHAFKLIRK